MVAQSANRYLKDPQVGSIIPNTMEAWLAEKNIDVLISYELFTFMGAIRQQQTIKLRNTI